MNDCTVFDNPLASRYASKDMVKLFSMQEKIKTWRLLWIALAEGQKSLGLNITDAQIRSMKLGAEHINWEAAEQKEREVRHDVMAHIYAFALAAPDAKPIIHLGATSCYVTDNADLIIMKKAMQIIAKKCAAVVIALANFASKYRDLPTVGLTHLQPAQPVTVGKRAALWAQDFILDLSASEGLFYLPMRGLGSATGTQASFLELFDGNAEKVRQLEDFILEKFGFRYNYEKMTERPRLITGQTYTRKIDTWVLNTLAGIGESAHKFATDVRLLISRKEMDEPFNPKQVGSSAMPHKRNPMRCERICGLSRFLVSIPINSYMTHMTQWMERTLDDSSNRRLTIPQAFMAADAILELCANVASGLVIYPDQISRNLQEEMPFLAMEKVLMWAAKKGGDRQKIHEKLRTHSIEASTIVRAGRPNDLIDRIKADPELQIDAEIIGSAMDPTKHIGLAPQQVDEFCQQVNPIRAKYNYEAGSAVTV